MTDIYKYDLPEAQKDKSLGISVVWFIPLIAIFVGGWLAYNVISQRGPEILIIFDNAEGLEAGLTRIKYKEVNIGKVTGISLNSDLSKVHVRARLNDSISGHLHANTQFWIVRPRINSSGVSGLNTLISGIHIAMEPGDNNVESTTFQGLPDSPEIKANAEGIKVTLSAASLGSLDRGSPVYYRKIEVGEVTQYRLAQNGSSVQITLFIKEPYDTLVNPNTRFWNASGVNLQIGSNGVTASLESISSLISGGVSFETPFELDTKSPSTDRKVFILHSNRQKAVAKPFEKKAFFVMYFDGSLRGLNKEATVEFRGIKVGKVVDIDLSLEQDTYEVKAPILVELHPETLSKFAQIKAPEKLIEEWINKGLRAQLKTASLITGQLYIDLSFQKSPDPFLISYTDNIPIFPTIPATFDRLTQSATDALENFSKIPLLEISKELREAAKRLNKFLEPGNKNSAFANLDSVLRNVESLTDTLNKSMPVLSKKIESSIGKLDNTLSDTQSLISKDSQMIYDIQELIRSLSGAARSFESLTNYLERNPSALLYGKGENQ